MKRLQESVAGKILAVVLLVCTVFIGGRNGTHIIEWLPFNSAESYQDTDVFDELIQQELDGAAIAFAMNEALKDETLDYLTRRQYQDDLDGWEKHFAPQSTNLRGIVRNEQGDEVFSNLKDGEKLQEPLIYASFQLGNYYATLLEHGESDAPAAGAVNGPVYTIECAVVPEEQLMEGQVRDQFYAVYRYHHNFKDSLSFGLQWTVIPVVLAGLCLLYLLWGAGHKVGAEGIVLTWQEKIFFDLYLCVMVPAAIGVFALGFELMRKLIWNLNDYILYEHQYRELWDWHIAGIAALWVVFVGMMALTLRTFVVRMKAGTLARSTLLCRALMWCWQALKWTWDAANIFVRSLPFLWRVVVMFGLYFFVDMLLLIQAQYDGWATVLCVLLNGAVLMLLCWWAMGFHRLRKGSQAIAAGNLSHQIETSRMPVDLKQHAEDLNNISTGLQNAVNEQMKSERFKAELITNVSHDLKTPLTSIINYVDLLKSTTQTDPAAVEYIEVLDRKSQRLKKLTEDLVEASKASAGTLNVQREKLSMAQLVDQALGEYTERLENRGLRVVTSLTEEESYVYADGRHLWRVIDNLLSNCCKYALENTRVYVELVRGKGQVILSVKNISREPLNVPTERLMERFVRGEDSRTTEGSGLGLSIAKSLTELQGGTFSLAIDGDLFKAIVTLPQAG